MYVSGSRPTLRPADSRIFPSKPLLEVDLLGSSGGGSGLGWLSFVATYSGSVPTHMSDLDKTSETLVALLVDLRLRVYSSSSFLYRSLSETAFFS